MTEALITPEELADLEAKARARALPFSPNVVLRLVATIRAVTARAEAADKERDELREALRPFADEGLAIRISVWNGADA